MDVHIIFHQFQILIFQLTLCDCDDEGISLSDYFTQTLDGRPLFFSFRTCGYENTYATKACSNRTASECKSDPDCSAGPTGICAPRERKLFHARTISECNGTEEPVQTSAVAVAAFLLYLVRRL